MTQFDTFHVNSVSRKSFRKCSLKLTGAFVVFEGDLTRLASIAQRIIWWPTDRKDLSIRCIVVFVVSSEVVGCGGVFFAVCLFSPLFFFIYTPACWCFSEKHKETSQKKSLRKLPELIWKDGFSLAVIVKISASFWGFQKLLEKSPAFSAV